MTRFIVMIQRAHRAVLFWAVEGTKNRVLWICSFWLVVIAGVSPVTAIAADIQPSDKVVIAHGVSGGPYNSMASFVAAIQQNPDYVEADLQLTKDGVLICLHDPTLEQHTNIEEVFPDRSRTVNENGKRVEKWFVNDFTLDEIKSLDSDLQFVSLEELLLLVEGKAGLYLETKDPSIYLARGQNIDRALHEFLSERGIKSKNGAHDTPVIIQSFHEDSLKLLREVGGEDYTLIQLIWFSTWSNYMTEEGLAHVASYADGIGPMLSMVLPPSDRIIDAAHANGLEVHAWSAYEAFPPKGFNNAGDYSSYLLNTLGLDGLFTKYPAAARRGTPASKDVEH